jgi:hypothetical protein
MGSRVNGLNDEVVVLTTKLEVLEEEIIDADSGTESTRSLARRKKNVIYERESELMCIDKESKSQVADAEKIRDIIQRDCDKRSKIASEEYESVLIKVNEESDKMKTEVVTSSDAIISELDSESANMSVLEATPGSPQEYRMLQNKLQDAIYESVKKQLELKKILLFEATEELQTELDAQMLKTKS